MTTTDITPTTAEKKKARFNRPFFILLVLLGTFAAVHMASASNSPAQDYQKQLQNEVDTDAGAPRDGRDPSVQTQTSLAYAASQANGPGQQVDTPAADVTGTVKHVDPASVLPDTKNTGVLAGGCLLGFGTPGETCVQVGKVMAAQNGLTSGTGTTLNLASLPLSCDPTGQQALQGVQLNSTNPFVHVQVSSKAACNVSDLLSTTPLTAL